MCKAGMPAGVVLLVLAVHPPRQMHPTALWLGHSQFMGTLLLSISSNLEHTHGAAYGTSGETNS